MVGKLSDLEIILTPIFLGTNKIETLNKNINN
jgi:hypothetical protein